MHAFDFLGKDRRPKTPAFCVVYGDEPFLRREVLAVVERDVTGGDEESGFSSVVCDGRQTELRDVMDVLSTVVMFGSGRRLVRVDDADDFISTYRRQLEAYVAHPSTAGVLVLVCRSWPGNTRLAKAAAAQGLVVDCKAPTHRKIIPWLVKWANYAHGADINQPSASLMVEIVGADLGRLDQELAKLAAATPAGRAISPEDVRELVGGWRAKTVWQMLDAATGGDTADAVVHLCRLLTAGENPIAVMGQMAATLRRFAAATKIIQRNEAIGKPVRLRTALERAGCPAFSLARAESQLRHIGRQRAAGLYRQLLKADLDLKGESSLRPQFVLERLLVQLAGNPQRRDA